MSISEEERKILDIKLQMLLGDTPQSTPVRTAMCYCPAREPRTEDGKDFFAELFDDNEEDLSF